MSSPLPAPSWDAILYFFSNSLAIIVSSAVLFFALGVIYGWLTWAKYKRRARAFQEETDLLRHEIARLKKNIAVHSVTPDATPEPVAPVMSMEPVVEAEPEPAPAPEATPEPAPIIIEEAKTEPPAAKEPEPAPSAEEAPAAPALVVNAPEPRKESLAAAVLAHSSVKPEALPAAAPPDEVTNLPQPPADAPATPIEPEALALELPTIVEATPVAVPTPAVLPQQPLPTPSATPTDNVLAKTTFAAELASGSVQVDTQLGIRYASRPERWDDFTLMRGVAETLQHRLHECGIYTFKQIATWSDDTAQNVATRIHAKDRIIRDRWVQQARDLHYLKYGEKIG